MLALRIQVDTETGCVAATVRFKEMQIAILEQTTPQGCGLNNVRCAIVVRFSF
jgi:hypothetical protein